MNVTCGGTLSRILVAAQTAAQSHGSPVHCAIGIRVMPAAGGPIRWTITSCPASAAARFRLGLRWDGNWKIAPTSPVPRCRNRNSRAVTPIGATCTLPGRSSATHAP